MKTIKLTPIVYQIRIYDKGSYEDKSPYSAICLLQMGGDKEAYISGYLGSISKEIVKKIKQEIALLGITKLTMERKGKIKEWEI